MKVLHISLARVREYTDPEQWLQRIDFFTGILEELVSLGCEVESIHFIAYSGILRRNGVQYHFLPLRNNNSPQLWQYAKRLSPDVVVLHGLIFPMQSLLLTLFLGRAIKIVMQHHAERPLRFPKSVLQTILDRTKVAAYLFAANDLAQPWIKSGQIAHRNKIYEVMEVSSRFTPAKNVTRTHGANRLTYLWVGRLDDNKDPLTLVKAFVLFVQENPGHKLYLIFRGGNLLSELRRVISHEHSKSIVIVGEVPHDELEDWYRNSDFIISTSRYEGSGTAVCEALSCGCIPILPDIPSFRMMTNEGEVGILFRSGEPGSLHNALNNSTGMEVLSEKQRVLDLFQARLSFKAIARDTFSLFKKL